MNRKSIAAIVLLLPVVFGACSALSVSDEGPEIRIENRSQSNFANVRVVFPSDEVNYGPVTAGAFSKYVEVDEAYRYAFVEVMIGERRLVMQPIDFVGETLLEPGRYTYVLGLAPGGEQLTLELNAD